MESTYNTLSFASKDFINVECGVIEASRLIRSLEINSPETYISAFCLIKSAGFKKKSFTSGPQ